MGLDKKLLKLQKIYLSAKRARKSVANYDSRNDILTKIYIIVLLKKMLITLAASLGLEICFLFQTRGYGWAVTRPMFAFKAKVGDCAQETRLSRKVRSMIKQHRDPNRVPITALLIVASLTVMAAATTQIFVANTGQPAQQVTLANNEVAPPPEALYDAILENPALIFDQINGAPQAVTGTINTTIANTATEIVAMNDANTTTANSTAAYATTLLNGMNTGGGLGMELVLANVKLVDAANQGATFMEGGGFGTELATSNAMTAVKKGADGTTCAASWIG